MSNEHEKLRNTLSQLTNKGVNNKIIIEWSNTLLLGLFETANIISQSILQEDWKYKDRTFLNYIKAAQKISEILLRR